MKTLADLHSVEAEEATLGSCLIDPDAVMEVRTIIKDSTAFFSVFNRYLFESMCHLQDNSQPIDFLTVTERFKAVAPDSLDEGKIIMLLNAVPTSIHAKYYAQQVQDFYIRRELLRKSGELAESVFDMSMDVRDVVTEATALTTSFQGEGVAGDRFVDNETLMSKMVDDFLNDKPVKSVPWFSRDLNRMFGSMKAGRLYSVGACPKQGKTTLMSNVVSFAAKRGKVVCQISAEMLSEELGILSASRESGVSMTAIESHREEGGDRLHPDELTRFIGAMGKMAELKIVTDDTPAPTPSYIRRVLNRTLMRYGRVDLLVVDYFQRCRPDKQTKSDVLDRELISQEFANMAKEYDCPVLLLAQANPAKVEQRADKRPLASDIMYSSALMRDCNAMFYLYRDEMYNPDTTEWPNQIEVICRLNRNGGIGTVNQFFDGDHSRITDLHRQSINL